MITQCSHCSTKFEISKELIESQDPRVRCGECLNVFNAKIQLIVEEEFSETVVPTVTRKVKAASQKSEDRVTAAAELESYISADDFENAATIVLDDPGSDADNAARRSVSGNSRTATVNDEFYSPDMQLDYGRPAAAKEDALDSTTLEFERTLVLESQSTREPAEAMARPTALDVDARRQPSPADPAADRNRPDVASQRSVTSDETLDPESLSRDDGQTETARSRDSAVELRSHVSERGGGVLPLTEDKEVRRKSSQQKSMLVPLLCCAAALLGVLYLARDQIAQLDLPEPVLGAFCSVTGCELTVAQDIERLELLRHKMSSHPTLSDVLEINVDVINRAPFPQPYPVLSITMTDTNGGVVAERKFKPEDYLEPESIEDTLPTNQLVRIKFEILDPGPEASSSELVFE